MGTVSSSILDPFRNFGMDEEDGDMGIRDNPKPPRKGNRIDMIDPLELGKPHVEAPLPQIPIPVINITNLTS